MKKIKMEEKYLELLIQTQRDQKNMIDELLRMNRDIIYETRNLITQFKTFVEKGTDIKNKK